MRSAKSPILVSACLAGVACRYDGQHKGNEAIADLLKKAEVLIICPEVLGGLSIPRTPCQIMGGDGADVLAGKAKVIGEDCQDYTQAFIDGAKKGLALAIKYKVKKAYLREKSPSCGNKSIYHGDALVSGSGVLAALLKQHNIEVIGI